MEQIQVEQFSVTIDRKLFRRRLLLQVRPDRSVRVLVGARTSNNAIAAFILQHREWLSRHLTRFQVECERFPQLRYRSGEIIPLLGRELRLLYQTGQSQLWLFDVRGDDLVAFSPTGFDVAGIDQAGFLGLAEPLRRFYQQIAQNLMPVRVHYWSKKIGVSPKKLSIRGQKTLWGSCTHFGHISLNFKLMVFPTEVADYVIVHELCHMRYQNHSRAFWNLVEQYLPNYREVRKFLRLNQRQADFLSE